MSFSRIFICGNIAAGKTTLSKYIASRYNVKYIPEPVEELGEVEGNNLLLEYYVNPQKYACPFQLLLLREYFQRDWGVCTQSIDRHVICDRSMEEVLVFSKAIHNAGMIDVVQLGCIIHELKRYRTLLESVGYSNTKILFLNTDIDLCISRLYQRRRHEEMTADKDYIITLMKELDLLYKDWLTSLHPTRIITTTGIDDAELSSKLDNLLKQ